MWGSIINHAASTEMNSGKIWPPNVEAAARAWMDEAVEPTRHCLQTYLLSLRFDNLPSIEKIGSWLSRHQTKVNKDRKRNVSQDEKPSGLGMLNFAAQRH